MTRDIASGQSKKLVVQLNKEGLETRTIVVSRIVNLQVSS